MQIIKRILFGNPIHAFWEKDVAGFYHKNIKYIHYSPLRVSQTAFYRISALQKIFFVLIVYLLLIGLYIDWKTTLIGVVAVLTMVYFADLLFNLFLIMRSFRNPPEIIITDEDFKNISLNDLPSYTVLCPLYKEWAVVPQFIKAMSELDYPLEKLQVMLLLEEDDKESIDKISEMNLPKNFVIEIIPHSMPKTKPKALNYGLQKATGEMIVIYDAEDIPEIDQLKKCVIAFRKADKSVKCIQAKLNFYNPHQNIITKVFTAEYSLWFDLVLTGLQSVHAPIPLGGTSNHFRKIDLIELKGWDSFNVTEDADLGMRIVKAGYRTAMVESTTYEEANSNALNWFWQRTRWIKGYMQTYLVHMRRPGDFLKHKNNINVITFQLVIGGKITSLIINPIMWTLTISYFIFRQQIGPTIESLFPAVIFYMAALSLVLGNFLYVYYYMVGCVKRNQGGLAKYMFLVPFYWLSMSLAAYASWVLIIIKPHHWAKTKHGLHITKNIVNKI